MSGFTGPPGQDPANQGPQSQDPPTGPIDHGAPTGPMNRPQFPGPPPGPGYQDPVAGQGPGYPGPGYQQPVAGPVPGYQGPMNPSQRRGHALRNMIIVVVALLAVLVGIDRLAVFFVQGKIASEIQNQGFPSKPDVTVHGFPFLTQVVSRHFQNVQISSKPVQEGPVEIKTINADMSDVRMNSGYSGGTIGHLSGHGVITFGSLSNALGSLVGGDLSSLIGNAGLTLKPVGSHEVKASIDVLVASGSATWRITRVNGNKIKVHLVSSHGLPSDLLSSVRNIPVPIPQLPLGMKIQSVIVTPDGISIRVTGNHVAFGS
jgi:LmeA-like phospholipid-binding